MKKIFALVIAILTIASTSFAQNAWTQKADFGGTARYGAVSFSIDDKGYIGTGSSYPSHPSYNDFWEYDPTLDAWTQKADFGGEARYYAVGFSIGSRGYIGTGYDETNFFHDDFWQYDPTSNVWTQKADFGGTARCYATGFSIGSKGYLGLGFDETFLDRKDFWEYDPNSNIWTQKTDFGGYAESSAVGFPIANKGYIATYLGNDFWEYDPDANIWTPKADYGGSARVEAFGFSIGDKGYIGTGMGPGGKFLQDFWEYNSATDVWTKKADFEGGPTSLAVAFSINGKAYAGTGLDKTYVYKNDFYEYTPDNSCTTPTATITPLGNLDICVTGFTKLQASGGNDYTYQWNRNQVDVPGATNQIFKVKKTGNYRVRISTGPGCHAVSKKTVVYSSCKLGEEEELNSSLNLFPNPTTGTFTLDLKLDDEENSQAIIQVLNMLGQVVYDETTSMANGALQKEIQFNDTAVDGMYLVKVIINNRVFSSQINYQK